MKPAHHLLTLLVAVATATACKSTKPTDDKPMTIEASTFDTSLHVSLGASTHTSSGLYYRDLTPGTGAVAVAGKQVSVFYTGWLADGTKFDSRVAGQPPFMFTLGAGAVIAGWDEGVAGMKVGGIRQLIVPASLGYGSPGMGSIPPNANLVFSVELLDVK